MYAIKQFYLKLFTAKTTMKDKTIMCDEIKIECCKHADPPWESPQVIPAQIRRGSCAVKFHQGLMRRTFPAGNCGITPFKTGKIFRQPFPVSG